jgi:hypothetical protein
MKNIRLKNFLMEIVKPILIFTIYIVFVTLLSNTIGIYFNTNASIVAAGVFIVTYPIYYHFINN